MTGEQLRAEIIKLLDEEHRRSGRWADVRYFHSFDPLQDREPGFPDLFLCGPRGFLFAECKGQGEPLSPNQGRWKWAILASGAPWFLWQPSDWYAGTIRLQIAAIA